MASKSTEVQKYGGTSVANPERIKIVAEEICQAAQDKKVVVVVSAMGKETDHLIELASEIYNGLPPRDELDVLLATGEIQSASLLAIAIKHLGKAATSLTGWQIQLEADARGRVKRVKKINAVKELLEQGNVVVVAGFQGVIEGTDKVVTLGRGGSDLTAVILAAALGLDYCKIFTDVDGIFTVDPRVVPKAKRFKNIAYSQMIQLSGAGTGKPQDRAVILAQNLGVKIEVLLSPSFGKTTGGTLICSESSLAEMESSWYQPGLAIQKAIQIKISDVPNQPGMAVKILEVVSDINIVDSVQVPGVEKTDISMICLPEDSARILSKLHGIKEAELVGKIKISEPLNVAELTLVDPLMKEAPGYLWRVFGAMARVRTNIEMFSSSGTTISVVVKEENLERAAQVLAEEFDLLAL